MATEAHFLSEADIVKGPSGTAYANGEVILLSDGRVGIATADFSTAQTPSFYVSGTFDLACVTGFTATIGDELYWDYSGNTTIAASSAILEDFYIGRCDSTKASGPLTVRCRINAPRFPQALPVCSSLVYEFDCETGVDSADHILIPAAWNKKGLMILGCYGIVTEQFAGTEDQGIVTIKDNASPPQTLSTLTASNAGADALKDVIVGVAPGKILGATTGDATLYVDAGKYVAGAVTQATTGSAAGKMKVRVLFCSLI